MSRRHLIDLGVFQLAWLGSALAAASHLGWLGVLATGAACTRYVALSSHRGRAASVVLICGAIGLVAETALMRAGLVGHVDGWPLLGLAPAWIVGLWLAFATTLPAARHMIGQRPVVAAGILGAVLGPLSYLAGERLGALVLPGSFGSTWLVLAGTWCLAYPAMIKLQDALAPGQSAE